MHSPWNLSKPHNHALAFGTPIHDKNGFVLKGFVDYLGPNQSFGWVWDSADRSRRLNVVAVKDTKITSAMVQICIGPTSEKRASETDITHLIYGFHRILDMKSRFKYRIANIKYL